MSDQISIKFLKGGNLVKTKTPQTKIESPIVRECLTKIFIPLIIKMSQCTLSSIIANNKSDSYFIRIHVH